MLPGPDKYYECPQCTTLIRRRSLASGNTFDSIYYSDGKRDAPSLPEFPELAKCKQCHLIFWISEANEVKPDKEAENIPFVEFMSILEYSEALQKNFCSSKDEEMYVRQSLWWAFNDRVREGEELITNDNEETIWRNNNKAFLKLLDITDDTHKVYIAELHRNLGDFNKCKDTLQGIEDNKLDGIKEKILEECEKGNKYVVKW